MPVRTMRWTGAGTIKGVIGAEEAIRALVSTGQDLSRLTRAERLL